MSSLSLRGLDSLDKVVAAYADTPEEATLIREVYRARMEGVETVYPDGSDWELAQVAMLLAVDHGAAVSQEFEA